MKSFLFALIFAVAMTIQAAGQANPDHYTIFTSDGKPATLDDIMRAAAASDAVFLGEYHDDTVAHALQFEIFKRAVEQFGPNRKVQLSLEMFERDVQVVLDEYLAGRITEDHFLRSSRPWNNYKTDYRPLVELAKEKRLPVIAANAPRRYVNMVARLGRDSVLSLSKDAKKWLAPLPFGEPSEAYSKKFNALMGKIHDSTQPVSPMLYSQTLWDATMAYWVAKALKEHKGSLVVHLNGGFHTESRLGTIEKLAKYRSKAKSLVVTMRYEENFRTFDPAKHTGLGDFVILTDSKQPRSQR